MSRSSRKRGHTDASEWPRALFASLELFAHDADLHAVLEPIRCAIEHQIPGWRCRIRRFEAVDVGAEKVEDDALKSIVLAGLVQRRPSFVRLDGLGRRAVAAPLLVSDHHIVGALIMESEDAAVPTPELSPFLIGLCRLMALFIEDRSSLDTMREQSALLEAILDNLPDAVLVTDKAGLVSIFNTAAETLFGWSRQEVIDGPLNKIIPGGDLMEQTDILSGMRLAGLTEQRPCRQRLDAAARDGRHLPIEVSLSTLRQNGEPCFIASVRDVSDDLAREERLADLRRQVEDTARLHSVGEMAASIAHEVNQPLTAIGNYLDAAIMKLNDSGRVDGDVVSLIERARRMTEAGGEVVKRVRRLTEGGPIQLERLELDDPVDETLEHFEPAIRRAHTRLFRERAAMPAIILGDRIQVQQVVSNLLRNALDALDGQNSKQIKVATHVDDAAVRLTVEDSGPGVPPGQREDLFRSFSTSREDGLGLGLAISQRIAAAHGGRIEYTDKPGGGARFILSLPLHED
jgi:two-component system sensor kinase FixL